MSCDKVDRLNSKYILPITDEWMITAVVWVLYDYWCMLALQFCNSDDDLNIIISEWMVWNDVLTMPDNNVWFDAWCMM